MIDTFAGIERVWYVLTFAVIVIVTFMRTLVSAAKDSIMRRAREYARKDGFKEGIHV